MTRVGRVIVAIGALEVGDEPPLVACGPEDGLEILAGPEFGAGHSNSVFEAFADVVLPAR